MSRRDEEIELELRPLLDMVNQEVYRVGKRLPARAFERDELLSYAMVGLCEARMRFDKRTGVPVTAFARLRVRGALIDALRGPLAVLKRRHLEHLKRGRDEWSSESLNLVSNVRQLSREYTENYAHQSPTSPEDSLLRKERQKLLNQAVDTLSLADRQLIRSMFGFDGEAQNGERVAVNRGCHRSSVSRRKHKILAQLKRSMKANEATANASSYRSGQSPRSAHACGTLRQTRP